MYKKIRNKIAWKITYLLVVSPWYKAFLMACTKKYRESPLWRNRCVELGDKEADEMYIKNLKTELPFWKWKVKKDKLLMLKIILTPYSINL
jgi:hypothetical protein